MSYFQIRQARGAFDFEGEHPSCLPGLHCRICGPWAITGQSLPSVSVEGHPLEKQFSHRPVWIKEWFKLRDALLPLLPPSEPVSPGLEIGPLVGFILNRFRIGWYHSWGFVVSEALRDELATLAPQIQCVQTRIRCPYGDRYYELEIRSYGRAITPPTEEPCSTCGRDPIEYPRDALRICDAPDLPLFRLANFPTIIIVREDLLPFFQRELGLAVTFRRAELVA